ncbi:MAG: efflux RND transporter periplasmic adaptor subunit [Rhodospirillales bacterium]
MYTFVFGFFAIITSIWGGGVYADEPQAVQVIAQPLKTGTVVSRFTAHGTVEPSPRKLFFLEPGFLRTLRVSEGDAVKKGDVLAQLDDQLISTSVAFERIRLRESEADLERSTTLQSKGVVPKTTLDDARDTVDRVRQELAETIIQQERHTLRSPVDGIIIRRYVDHPQPITTDTEVFAIRGEQDDWLVEVNVPQQAAIGLRPGDDALISIPAIGEDALKGVVDTVAGVQSDPDGLYRVRLQLLDDLPNLKAGLRVSARLPQPQGLRTGPIVPVSALHDIADGRAAIYVAKDIPGIAERLSVKIASIDGTDAVLDEDLNSYNWVITGGTYRVQSGDPVMKYESGAEGIDAK